MADLEVVVRVLEAVPVTRVPVLAVVVLEVIGVVVLVVRVVVLEVMGVVVLLIPSPLVAFDGVAGGIDAFEFVRE